MSPSDSFDFAGSTGADVRARAAAIVDAIEVPLIPERELDLIAHSGLTPDLAGTHDFAAAVEAALGELSAAGGGRLLLRHPAGAHAWIKPIVTYRLRGPLQLRSHIALELDPCVRLLFEFAPEAYSNGGKGVYLRYEGTSLFSFSPCIYAFNCTDVAIRARPGSGAPPVIDGDGWRWQEWAQAGQSSQMQAGQLAAYERLKQINNRGLALSKRRFADPQADFFRPTLLGLYFSERILVENVKLKDSPFWVVHPVFCRHAVFRRLLFDAYVVNNDGIDPESSSHVLIEDVVFGNHDDNVAIKGGRDLEGREGIAVAGTDLENLDSPYIVKGVLNGPTENIVVRNCCFEGHYGFCVGSDLANTTQAIFAIDNFAVREVGMAVYIKSSRRRGGRIHDIHVAGLQVKRARAAVVCLNANYDNDATSSHPPFIGNVTIRGVRVAEAGAGIRITGWQDAPIRDVLIEDLRVAALKDDAADSGQHLQLINAEGICLRQVEIAGKVLDGENLAHQSDDAPPHVI